MTVEEFFRKKIKEKNPNIEVVTLSKELITAEEGVQWANEFKQLIWDNLKPKDVSYEHKNTVEESKVH